MTRKVAIIGGGSAGVVQAQQLWQVNDELRGKKADTDHGPHFEPTIFERRTTLGSGLWAHDADPGPFHLVFTPDGRAYPRWETTTTRQWPPGAMYDGLKTNIPSDLMTYRDAPFEDGNGTALFPSRGEVEKYLTNYAQKDERVRRCARLGTSVTRVERVQFDPSQQDNWSGSKWSVTSLDHSTQATSTEIYDHIVFANGRCNVPSIPPIYGLWNFKGEFFHSAWYRTPLIFRDRKVLIVGNNSSGMDIARELCGHIVRDFEGRDKWLNDVKENATGVCVYNSVEDITKPPNLDYDPRDPDSPEWSKKIQVVPRIQSIREDGVVLLENGEELADVDTLVFATGFYVQYECVDHTVEPFKKAPLVPASRPVISAEQLQREENLLARLARQDQEMQQRVESELSKSPVNSGPASLDDWYLFYEADRSMAFLGLPSGNVPFPLTHVQARYIAAFWSGQADVLPPIDREISPMDGSRWSKPLSLASPRPLNQGPMQLAFGHPSDMDYLDALLSHIMGAGGQPPWERDALGAAEEEFERSCTLDVNDTTREEERQKHLAQVRAQLKDGPELWYRVTAWRRQRRRDNKTLRRREIGY